MFRPKHTHLECLREKVETIFEDEMLQIASLHNEVTKRICDNVRASLETKPYSKRWQELKEERQMLAEAIESLDWLTDTL